MELSRDAEDALFALFAVRDGFVSEGAVERALARRGTGAEGKSLQRLLVESGALTLEQAHAVKERLDPEVIPGYRIEGEAGRGGMGVVYRARQLSMDRPVAVKILSRRLSKDEAFVAKFLAEAKAAAKLNHENVVSAIDAGEAGGLHYFVMEFVDGESVADRLDRGEVFDYERAFAIAEDVAMGLAHAHAAGLVHRDVKPENIMLTADGRAKLCDLGLAKPAQEAGTGEKSATTEGTPYYCSPEQALGRTDIDPRSDIYSLGTTLYHMLTGEPPYDGETARAIMAKQVREPFPDLDAKLAAVPEPYRRLIEAMVVKDRERRLPSVRAFEERLLQARNARGNGVAQRTRRSRASVAGLAGLAAACLGVGGGVLLALFGGGEGAVSETGRSGEGAEGAGAIASSTAGEPAPAVGGGTAPDRVPAPPQGTGGADLDVEPQPVAGGDEGDPELKEARALFRSAREYQDRHPDDPWGARDRFARVVSRFPASPVARQAEAEMDALAESLQEAATSALGRLAQEVLRQLDAGDYRAALEEVNAFAARWKPRHVPQLAARLARLRASVTEQADARLKTALARVDAGEEAAYAELEQLAEVLPEGPLAERARKRLVERARANARALRARARDRAFQTLREGHPDAARRLLEDALGDPASAPARELLERDLADLASFEEARRAYAAALRALPRAGPTEFPLADGQALRGHWISVDEKEWVGDFELDGGGVRRVPLAEARADWLVRLGLPAGKGRANALLLLARGAPQAARAALKAWEAATGRQDPELSARVAAEADRLAEERARLWLDRALAPGRPPAEVVAELKAPPRAVRRADAYRRRFEELKVRYREARAQQLRETPGSLFRGQVSFDRKGRVTLEYDFAAPEQAEDFVLDLQVAPRSRREVRDGELIVSGKVLHVARFAGGEIKLDLRATPRAGGAANVNLLIGSGPGWRGHLAGGGFRYGTMKEIKIDAAARKKGGYVVDLPANVFLPLDGLAPSPRMRGVLAAEAKPQLKPRRTRFVLQRTSKGKVRFKIGSRTIYAVEPTAGWDAPGAIGFSPFASEVAIDELVVKGILDPGWTEERAAAVASSEAEALPGPEQR
ncbi:MAG: hypothetical protein D6731_11360 [Planctomycetota bacterium]|nr:MAG: hypothetical protein D6731_11360 [Planctomycetota bacterium]